MRPLLALIMPKYFSNTKLYTDAPGMFDIERQPDLKHVRAPSNITRNNNIHESTYENQDFVTNTSQLPKSTLSRTPSGRFAIKRTFPSMAGRTGYISHSRSESNISINIAAADARLQGPRLQKQFNPLPLSLMTPYSPLNSRILFPASGPGTSCMPSRNTSGTSTPVIWRPHAPFSPKPLPLTPLPVSAGA
jgi:hypothetical protein